MREVNDLIVWFSARASVDLAHGDLTRGEQRPEQHGGGLGTGRTVWVVIRRLNSSCNRSIAFEARIDFHWLGGNRVNVKSLSPASSRLSEMARHLRRATTDECFSS